GNGRLDDGRDALTRGRVLFEPRCRLGRTRGQVLRLEPGGSPGPARSGRIPGVRSPFRARRRAELRRTVVASPRVPLDRAGGAGHRTYRQRRHEAPAVRSTEAATETQHARAAGTGRENSDLLERARDPWPRHLGTAART